LNLTCDKLLSNFGFNCNLRHYIVAALFVNLNAALFSLQTSRFRLNLQVRQRTLTPS